MKTKIFFFALFTLICFISRGQINDSTFNPGAGANGVIRTTTIQADGKILIGGDFTIYNGDSINYLARINSDGSRDNTFDAKIGWHYNGRINAITIHDGKIVIGGGFYTCNGDSIKGLARLNSNGNLDPTFIGQTSNGITAFTIQSDDKIIIGSNRIARLNSNGVVDTTFEIGGFGTGIVYTTIQVDDKIIVGGSFLKYNGINTKGLLRLNSNGSLDTTFIVGIGTGSLVVYSSALQSDGKIIVGGYFTNKIARLHSNGSLDTTFKVGTGANGYIYSLTLQSDGKIIIGGSFTAYNGIERNRLARLNSDGSLDTTFNVGTGTDNIVYSTTLGEGKLIVGGAFTTYNGIERNKIACLLFGLGNSGVKDLVKKDGYSPYPNPTKAMVKVTTVVGAEVIVYSLMGRELSSQKCNSDHETIDLSAFEAGVYMIGIKTNKNTHFYKIVKE